MRDGEQPLATAPRPAVFLDRDGVLNEVLIVDGTAEGPLTADSLRVPTETAEALAPLLDAGFLLIVITNQPEVARGRLTLEELQRTNRRLLDLLPVHAIYFCPHDNQDGCGCRKPLAGMIHRAVSDWSIDLAKSYLIGDRWVDIACAGAAGIGGILLEADYSWKKTSSGGPPDGLVPIFNGHNLAECVGFVLEPGQYRPRS